MAVRSGFWNSLGADIRTYYNSDFSHLISLLVKDGVHQTYGAQFIAKPGEGMQVIIQRGEAWFNETWVRNDTDLQVAIDAAPIVSGYSRIDSIVIKIDASTSAREGTITYITGAAGSSPVAPTLTDTEDVHYHKLCDVRVAANVTSITASMITNYIGTTTTPFITGILSTIDITSLLSKWESQWNDWLNSEKMSFTEWRNSQESGFEQWRDDQQTSFHNWRISEQGTYKEWEETMYGMFERWFETIKGQLDTDIAGHLQQQLNEIRYIYVTNETLFMPNTGGTYDPETRTLVLGFFNDNEGGN